MPGCPVPRDAAARSERSETWAWPIASSTSRRSYPGGQQQRVAMARAVVTNPSLVLADEPTGNLDSHSTAEVLEIFGQLNLRGATVLLITHEEHVAATAKRIVRLADGRVAEDERTAAVREIPPILRGRLEGMIRAETLRIALGGLRANKLRSGLTILGLTIGVASVIVLIAVGNGSSQTVQKRIESLGSNVLLITRLPVRGGSRAGVQNIQPLTEADASALADPINAPDVASSSPVVNATATLVASGISYSPSQFVGTTPSYASAHTYSAASGTLFTQQDESQHHHVLVIGPTVASNLFPGQNPVGQTVQVNGSSFQVAGVTSPKGSNGIQDQDDIVLAPLTAVQDQLTGFGNISSITVQAKSRGQLDAASAEVTSILDQRHHIQNPLLADFRVINQGSILAASSSTSQVFTTLLGEVAAISLLVGGIGVMNIMLVSVTERTREIGIRKAIGARRGDILAQFLTEAVLVSLLGGISGAVLGIVGSQFRIAGVQPAVAGYSIFMAFGAAVLTGLFFGTYPATRAARLRPIEALRFE